MCGELSPEELFILYVLYTGRNLNRAASRHPKTIERVFKKKEFTMSFDTAIQQLQNKGFISAVKKKPVKYYISDTGRAIKTLAKNGFQVIKGRERPL